MAQMVCFFKFAAIGDAVWADQRLWGPPERTRGYNRRLYCISPAAGTESLLDYARTQGTFNMDSKLKRVKYIIGNTWQFWAH